MDKKTALIAALLLAGCMKPAKDNGQCSPGLERDYSSDNPRCVAPGWGDPPPRQKRTDVITETKAVEGLVVSAAPDGDYAWTLTVENNRTEAVALIWDESTFVTPKRTATGRMIRGQTRKMNTDRAQPPSPVPAGARLREWCTTEDIASAADTAEREGSTFFLAPEGDEPGRLIIVFETSAGKATWEGAITFNGAAPPPVAAGPGDVEDAR